MGVTMYCKKTGRSIDMSYFGMTQLRDKVAELAGIGEHYQKIAEIQNMDSRERTAAFDEYDRKTNQMISDGTLKEKVAMFLWESDYEANLPYGVAKELLKVIGDYDDDTIYGYAGRPDRAMFKDFKAILQDCVETKSRLIWH